MTPEKTEKVLKYYLTLLGVPAKLPEDYYDLLYEDIPHVAGLSAGHAAWMCQQAIVLVEEGRMEKAMRWLGWINYALWRGNYLTLNQIKQTCAPDDQPAKAHVFYEVLELGPDPQGRDAVPNKNGDVLPRVVFAATEPSGPATYAEHMSKPRTFSIGVIGMSLPGTSRLLYGMVHEHDARAEALSQGRFYGYNEQPHPLFPDVHWYVGTREELAPICMYTVDPRAEAGAETIAAAEDERILEHMRTQEEK